MTEKEHTFRGSDTPGTFECPACPASAHFEREEQRYCIHPANKDEQAFLVDGWDDPAVATAHGEPIRYVAQWYMELKDLGPSYPHVLYGVYPMEAYGHEDAAEQFEELLDVDFLAHPVYRIGANGVAEYDLDQLPDDWNFERVVLVDLQEEAV